MSTDFDSNRLRCYWFTADEYQDVILDIEIQVRKFCEDVQRLKQDPFLAEVDFLPTEINKMANELVFIENSLKAFKKIQEQYEQQKKDLLKAMQENKIESFRMPDGTLVTAVKAVPPSDKIEKDFDHLAFAVDHPRLLKKYTRDIVKHSNGRKAYLKITYKEEQT
jgi:hypothetical protein